MNLAPNLVSSHFLVSCLSLEYIKWVSRIRILTLLSSCFFFIKEFI
uniref:Uncharacterized protein n=1 Tax=Rhizophora mucronata TaxID=61149 RepID=A0A2P2N9G4_RHIMU